jgi:hypothetical protein
MTMYYYVQLTDETLLTRVSRIDGGTYLSATGRGMGLAFWVPRDEARKFETRREAQSEISGLPSYLREKAKVTT